MHDIGNIKFAKLKFIDSIPRENYRKLGAKYWLNLKKIGRTRRYLELQNSLLQDAPESDIPIGGVDYNADGSVKELVGENFRNELYAYLPKFIASVNQMVHIKLTKSKAIQWPGRLLEIHKVSKSAFEVNGLYKTLKEYIEAPKKRKPFTIPIKAKELYIRHCLEMVKVFNHIRNLDPEEQESIIIQRLPAKKNIGYDLFEKQEKETFRAKVMDFMNRWFGIKDEQYLTIDYVLKCIRFAMAPTKSNKEGTYFPDILFYRTQGGKTTKIRAVFGAAIILKLIAIVISACKREAVKVKIGDLPWIASDNWDELFTHIVQVMSKDKHEEWVGEDFSGFDMHIIKEDIDWIINETRIPSEYRILLTYCIKAMEFSDVWTGDYAVKGIFFKSGNPFTSEFGSLVHLSLIYWISEITGWRVKHCILQSDDNLTCWVKEAATFKFNDKTYVTNGFKLWIYVKLLKSIGFEVSMGKTFVLSRDHFVTFLQVWIGPIFTDEFTFIGNLNSRYYGLLHAEREVEEGEGDVGLWVVTGKVRVDQVLSKLGSMSRQALPFILGILVAVKDTTLGREVINAIMMMKQKIVTPVPVREDVPIGFSPIILTEINLDLIANTSVIAEAAA